MIRFARPTIAVLCMLVAACGTTDRAARSVASHFEERATAGDVEGVWGMLSNGDHRAVRQQDFPDSAFAGVNRIGLQGVIVDSSTVVRRSGDTAIVAVHMMVPNFARGGNALWARATEPDSDRGADFVEAVNRLPRVGHVDTVRLVNEGGEWKVALGIAKARATHRQNVAILDLYSRIDRGYLDRPLSARAADARTFIAAARRAGWDENGLLNEANEVALADSVAQQLVWNVHLDNGGWLSDLRGSVTNPTDLGIHDLIVSYQTDGGETGKMFDMVVTPHSSTLVHDTPAPHGRRVVAVRVLAAKADRL